MLRRATITAAMLLAAGSTLMPLPARAERDHGGPGGVLFKIIGAIRGGAQRVDEQSMRAFEEVPRLGSCEDRRGRILALLPDALRFARLASTIDADKHAPKMRAEGLATLDLGDGRTAHFDAKGKRYAEVLVDEARGQVVVVFQGTRLAVQSDVTADVISFIGLQSGYHRWASELVANTVREHAGKAVIVTGHSLGGGLAIYAVLQNPGVKGFAFNPAGVALLTWGTTSGADRARASAALTVVSTRNEDHIEPVTALSLAGRLVLPGHVLILQTRANGPVALHSSATVVQALEAVEASNAAGDVCEGDLGELID